LEGGSDSIIAIAVGCAEGTRTADGGFTNAYFGHTDPGNGAQNQGSFSYQHPANSPAMADKMQLQKIKYDLLPKFEAAVTKGQILPLEQTRLFAIACDVFTQSELACLGKGGFLGQMQGNFLVATATDGCLDVQRVIDWRVNAYYDPATGELDAPGFGNNLGRLIADQERRTKAVLRAIA